jgi:Ankyrin repeats (many copies)
MYALRFYGMRNFTTPLFAATGFVLVASATPAFAQMAGGPAGAPGGAPQPQQRVPDIAPAALPGAGGAAPVATGPVMQKPTTGDPTTALFAAVNSGDYNAAQDAISRGANLYAQNAFGETPLDLSVALNRSSITFLILGSRNEMGDPNVAPGPAFPSQAVADTGHHKRSHILPAADNTPQYKTAPIGNIPGTPNPAAGFLGFNPQS